MVSVQCLARINADRLAEDEALSASYETGSHTLSQSHECKFPIPPRNADTNDQYRTFKPTPKLDIIQSRKCCSSYNKNTIKPSLEQ